MIDAHRQAGHAVSFEWGPAGAAALAEGSARADVAVVVDVLSFTTTVTVALDRGLSVYPYRWRDERAATFAAERDALLAVGRLEAREAGAGVSLSPAHLAQSQSQALRGVERIVLPSPNGSAICFALADAGCGVIGASLRNASAVAAWLAPRVRDGARLAVVAAGERWPDGSLRPAAEDLWGAGAVLAGLVVAGGIDAGRLSPEAQLAVDAFAAVRDRLPDVVSGCASGQELVAAGFADDVALAADRDVSSVVPLLGPDGAFTDATAG